MKMNIGIFFAIAAVAASVLFIELLLHVACALFAIPVLEPDKVVNMMVDDPVLEYKGNPAYPDHDRNGFRNPAIPSSADIIVLGDSQSYGVNAPSDASWPRLLERKLKSSVYNMSFGSYSAATYLLLIDRAFAFKPRIILATVYTGNDLGEAYLFAFPKARSLHLRSNDPLVLRNIADIESKEPLLKRVTTLFNKGTVNERPIKPLPRFLLRNSKIYVLVRAAKWGIEDRLRKKTSMWDLSKQKADDAPQSFQVFEQGAFKTIFCSESRLSVLKLDDPRIKEGLRICLEALWSINTRCREKGIAFVVVGIPTKEFVFKDLALEQLKNTHPYPELIANEMLVWKEIKEFLEQEKITFIDCLVPLQSVLKGSLQPYSQNGDGHPNAIGYEAIATSVAESLKTGFH
ncbi:MAG: hypothetical protein PHS64_02590 [Candidatus Omnitrophica bacterium]|nr:hypothetical protein [Candidatus Omnitrophota bacterium]